MSDLNDQIQVDVAMGKLYEVMDELVKLWEQGKRLERELSEQARPSMGRMAREEQYVGAREQLNSELEEARTELAVLRRRIAEAEAAAGAMREWITSLPCTCEPEVGLVPCERCAVLVLPGRTGKAMLDRMERMEKALSAWQVWQERPTLARMRAAVDLTREALKEVQDAKNTE